ncbi:MAG: DNA methyltransferase [Oscillospiraceae bacterium]
MWDKEQPFDFTLAMCKFAWTSFEGVAKIYRRSELADKGKIHPTQKPVPLYERLLVHCAKEGDKILDTHVSSASSLIACHNMGFSYIGFEIDRDYYRATSERLEAARTQMSLFI